MEDKMKGTLAIDPGSLGGLAFISEFNTVSVYKMPETPKDLYDLLKSFTDKYIVECHMEKVAGRPGMGGAAMFNFGKGYGHLEMALLALEIKTTTLSPQKWQKTMMIGNASGLSKTEWKNKLKAKAQQLFPSVRVTLWSADALLILEYAKNLK